MKQKLLFFLLTAFAGVVMLSGCGQYQKVLNSDDIPLKYEYALKYYKEGKYQKALPLFNDIMPYYLTTPQAEDVLYHYAQTEYNVNNYLVAAYNFKRLYDNYPTGKYAEEALFNYAYALYLQSPRYNLDQSSTQEGIDALQYFVNKFPKSERVAEANTLIDKLRAKIEKKNIANARLYYKTEDYKSAIYALRTIIEEYPGTEEREELEFLILKSYYRLAQNSIESKKAERYQDAVDFYSEFVTQYPESTYANEANSIFRDAVKNIKNLSQL